MERLQVPVGPGPGGLDADGPDAGGADTGGAGLVLDVVSDGPEDGPLVLLLHGFPQTSWCWRGVVPGLVAAGYRVLAPDQRGYSPGARPSGVAAYAMSCLVADALAVLDAVGADRAHLVGHDWGAGIAWQLAARHPERIQTLTAVSVPHPLAFVEALRTDPDQRRRSQYMKDWLDPGAEAALIGDDLRAVFGDAAGVDTAHYLEVLREPGVLSHALAYYRTQSLADLQGLGPVTAPTLHVWSDGDAALGPAAARATASHVAGPYRFEVLQGVSHWIPEQAPEALTDLLLQHLSPGHLS